MQIRDNLIIIGEVKDGGKFVCRGIRRYLRARFGLLPISYYYGGLRIVYRPLRPFVSLIHKIQARRKQ